MCCSFLNSYLNGYFPGACNWDDALWLLPRGSVVMFFGIICYKIMFFIVCLVLSSSSSPQSRELDFQSIPQLNSLLGYFSSIFCSPIVHSSGKALVWDRSTKKITCEISIFLWVEITASAHIYQTLTLINVEIGLNFKMHMLGVSGNLITNVFQQMIWGANFIHIWGRRLLRLLTR